jgi:hypothetical protein
MCLEGSSEHKSRPWSENVLFKLEQGDMVDDRCISPQVALLTDVNLLPKHSAGNTFPNLRLASYWAQERQYGHHQASGTAFTNFLILTPSDRDLSLPFLSDLSLTDSHACHTTYVLESRPTPRSKCDYAHIITS